MIRFRLDEAVKRKAEAELAKPADPVLPLRDHLIAQHGPIFGELLFTAEMDSRRKDRERYVELRRKLDAKNVEIAAAIAHGYELLAPLHLALEPVRAELDRVHAIWLRANVALEEQRHKNQQDLLPLQNAVAGIIGELNVPLHSNRCKQWVPVEV